jgi:hypothetical protein
MHCWNNAGVMLTKTASFSILEPLGRHMYLNIVDTKRTMFLSPLIAGIIAMSLFVSSVDAFSTPDIAATHPDLVPK